MFNKKPGGNSAAATSTIIGRDCAIVGGTLSGQGSLRVDGNFVGTIDIDGHLILGENGSIEGAIKAQSATLAGRAVSSKVECADTLHIVSTGSLHGDISVGALVVDEDAVFIGNCKMDNGRKTDVSDHALKGRIYGNVDEPKTEKTTSS